MKKRSHLSFSFFSIRSKFVLVCSALIICVIFISTMIFNNFYEILRVNASQATVNVIERIKMNLELFISEIDTSALNVTYMRDVQRLVENNDPAAVSTVSRRLKAIQETIRREVDADVQLSVLSSQMRIIASSYPDWLDKQRVLGSHWIDKINRADGEKVIISGYTVANSDLQKNMKVISVARRMQTEDQKQKYYLLIDIPIEHIQRPCASLDIGGSGFIAVLDDDSFILYHTNEQQIGTIYRQTLLSTEDDGNYSIATIDNAEMLVSRLQSDYSGFTVLGAVPTSSIYGQLNSVRSRFFMQLGILLLASIVAVWLTTFGITRPILRMSRKMQRVEEGNFTPYEYPEQHDELGLLEKNFNVMLAKLNEMIDHVYRTTIREREAEYRALSANIRPHFLYNTLEAIALTAYMNNDLQTMDMLNLLADLFRYSTRSSSRLVRLENECAHAKIYLQIVHIRNPEQFEDQWDIPDELMGYMVPSMLLQPLVENAVQYAFRDMESGGVLRIHARKEGGMLLLTVSDNGEGMSAEQLDELTQLLHEEHEGMGMMALKNINDRILLAFGAEYGLLLKSAECGGFSVTVRLPVLEETLNGEGSDRR